jgi:hypothetical protein
MKHHISFLEYRDCAYHVLSPCLMVARKGTVTTPLLQTRVTCTRFVVDRYFQVKVMRKKTCFMPSQSVTTQYVLCDAKRIHSCTKNPFTKK